MLDGVTVLETIELMDVNSEIDSITTIRRSLAC